MSTDNSLAKQAELVLVTFYGGKIRTSNQAFESRQVMEWLIQSRDTLLDRELKKDGLGKSQPDSVWFTKYPVVAQQWDDVAEMVYITLPKGHFDMVNDVSIRIKPVKGSGNPFIRVPSGWMSRMPEMAWLEGNIGWEVEGSDRVNFPGLRRAQMGEVTVFVIETAADVDPDAPLTIPAGLLATARDMVLQNMGLSRGEDKNADNRDQQ